MVCIRGWILLFVFLAMPAPARSADNEAGLTAFQSDAEIQQWLDARAAARRASGSTLPPPPSAPAVSAASVASVGDSSSLDSIAVTGSRITPADMASITNVQTVGVDEGDIVKRSGDYLLVLRRGRLFSVRIGGDRLEPVASIDAYGPRIDPSDAWYDEMLVSDDTVVVIGYSYARGGTEVGIFRLDGLGGLHYRDTYQLRSHDYYSSRNYASRLIGKTLVFYAPLSLSDHRGDVATQLPALRRWHAAATPADFRRILPADRLYRSPAPIPDYQEPTVHAVTRCDLSAAVIDCQATATLGMEGRVFYVSEQAVYIWTSPWEIDNDAPDGAVVYRLPLDGGRPQAVRASGSPIDQMSLLEADGRLNVLVGSEADGEGMWRANSKAGELALAQIPLSLFGNGHDRVPRHAYRTLPGPDLDDYDLHNRYVGPWLLYGAGESWRSNGPDITPLHAVRIDRLDAARTLHVGHQVDRIDALGAHGIAVGKRGDDLVFSAVRLDDRAAVTSQYVQPDAEQGDDRTHGFFYRPSADDEGMLGLPVVRYAEDGEDSDAASVIYLRNRALRLRGMGSLDSRPARHMDDACKASCVDWYGDARPIFIGERVFALLGYELVEGRVDNDRIVERRRTDFHPD